MRDTKATKSPQRLVALILLFPILALAAIATAQQIIDAVRASPGANQWLRDNAEAVANLAINVESRGETTAYNGSCCYGVLQMTTKNIAYYGKGMSPEIYRQLSLQDQINMWTRLTVDALRAGAPRTLARMSTFDGRAVDGELVLACVQLGIGNCQRMINSGSCSGFADRNGTTICAMADRMQGQAGTGGGGGGTGGGAGGGSGTGHGTNWAGFTPTPSCIRNASGACVPITEALEIGFERGSGVSMDRMKGTIQLISIAVTLLIMGSAMLSLWKQYANGKISKPQFVLYSQKIGLVISIIFFVVAVF